MEEFSIVTDPAEVATLEDAKIIKLYRNFSAAINSFMRSVLTVKHCI